MSNNNWSETNRPSAQDAAVAEETLAGLTRGGQIANTDFVEWVNARITLDWAEHAQAESLAAEDGWAR